MKDISMEIVKEYWKLVTGEQPIETPDRSRKTQRQRKEPKIKYGINGLIYYWNVLRRALHINKEFGNN